MSLPPVITREQFEARAGRTLSGAAVEQFEAFAEDASALIRQAAGSDFTNEQDDLDAPAGILPVAFRVVQRAVENPLGHDSQTVGNFTWRKETRTGAAAIYLTDEDVGDIAAAMGRTGFVSVPYSSFPLPGSKEQLL